MINKGFFLGIEVGLLLAGCHVVQSDPENVVLDKPCPALGQALQRERLRERVWRIVIRLQYSRAPTLLFEKYFK